MPKPCRWESTVLKLVEHKNYDMTQDMIERFVELPERNNVEVNIHFKDRATLKGMFIRENDYEELKGKNFWRVISSTHLETWSKTKDKSIPRIFNGASFTRLTDSRS
jgi:hypothetical protein